MSPQVRAAAWWAFAWVVAFVALHVDWFLGGRVLRGDQQETYPVPTTTADHVYAVVVGALFVAGTLLPLLLALPLRRPLPRRCTTAALAVGTGLLLLRGLAGLLDTALREAGIAERGITGLTYEQITGDADPSAATLWSGTAIDAIFVLGGLLFGWTLRRYLRAGRP
jgi:hypothetical protein